MRSKLMTHHLSRKSGNEKVRSDGMKSFGNRLPFTGNIKYGCHQGRAGHWEKRDNSRKAGSFPGRPRPAIRKTIQIKCQHCRAETLYLQVSNL